MTFTTIRTGSTRSLLQIRDLEILRTTRCLQSTPHRAKTLVLSSYFCKWLFALQFYARGVRSQKIWQIILDLTGGFEAFRPCLGNVSRQYTITRAGDRLQGLVASLYTRFSSVCTNNNIREFFSDCLIFSFSDYLIFLLLGFSLFSERF